MAPSTQVKFSPSPVQPQINVPDTIASARRLVVLFAQVDIELGRQIVSELFVFARAVMEKPTA